MNIELLNRKMHKELKRRNSFLLNGLGEDGKAVILNAEYKESNLYIKKAYRCFLEDAGGNVYIDTALGAGIHILGHAHLVAYNRRFYDFISFLKKSLEKESPVCIDILSADPYKMIIKTQGQEIGKHILYYYTCHIIDLMFYLLGI